MSGFNDGIEAAIRHLRDQMPLAARNQKVILSGLVRELETLKRPEPSEAEVERVARAIFNVGSGEDETWESLHTRSKMTYREKARAALEAMKGEG